MKLNQWSESLCETLCLCLCVCVCVSVCACTCLCMCTHAHMLMCMCACMYLCARPYLSIKPFVNRPSPRQTVAYLIVSRVCVWCVCVVGRLSGDAAC